MFQFLLRARNATASFLLEQSTHAVHKASQTSQHLTFFVFFSEEEQKEDRGQEEEVGKAPGLPSMSGGGKGTSS